MKLRFVALAALMVLLSVSACVFDPGGLDPADEQAAAPSLVRVGDLAVDSVPDGWQFTRAERAGMLQVANEASLAELDDDARLDTRAAANIMAFRAGPDGLAGSADDRVFENLDALDAIKFVGPRAFDKLLAYARALGYVPNRG